LFIAPSFTCPVEHGIQPVNAADINIYFTFRFIYINPPKTIANFFRFRWNVIRVCGRGIPIMLDVDPTKSQSECTTDQQPDGLTLSKGLTSQVILEILGMILAERSLQEVLTCVVRVVEAQREDEGMLCSVWLLDQDRVHMRAIVAPTLPESYIAALDGFVVGPQGGTCGAAVNRREPVFVSDVLTDPILEQVRDAIAAHGIRACWSAPIISHQGEILGTFAFYFRSVRVPNPSDMQLIDGASRIAAIAIERKRAEQALAVQNTRLQLLLQLTKRITSNLELREVLRSISANVRKVVQADYAGVAFFDEASDKSRIYAVDFPDAKGFVKEEIVVTPGLPFKRAWESSKPVIVNANDPEEVGPEIHGLLAAEGLNGPLPNTTDEPWSDRRSPHSCTQARGFVYV
jgi:formate hydrogenlyase transcriptional activator